MLIDRKIIFLFLAIFQLSVVYPVNFNESLRSKKVNLQSLSIYKFLKKTEEHSQDPNVKSCITQTLSLLSKIIGCFNEEAFFYNPEIELSFFKICKHLEHLDKIKPYHLRTLKRVIDDLNDYLDRYIQSRRRFLNDSDVVLLNNILEFNNLLKDELLNNNYLDLTLNDKFLDKLLFKPWEKICEYKTAAITVAVIAVGGFCYYILKHCLNNSKDEPNENQKEFLVKQLPIPRNFRQSGLDCGLHTVLNGLCALSSDNENVVRERLNGKDGWEKQKRDDFIKKAKELIASKRNEKDGSFLHIDEIQKLFSNDGIQTLNSNIDFSEIKLENFYVFQDPLELKSGLGYTEELLKNIERFRSEGIAQGICIRPIQNKRKQLFDKEDLREGHKNLGVGHWFFAKIMKNPEAEGGCEVWAVDSNGANITKDHNLQYVVDLFLNQNVLSPGMLDVGVALESSVNVLEHNNDYNSALQHFNNAINLAIQKDCFNKNSFKNYQEEIERQFTVLQVQCNTENLESYIEKLTGQKVALHGNE